MITRKNTDRSVVTSANEYNNQKQRDYNLVVNSTKNTLPSNLGISLGFDVGNQINSLIELPNELKSNCILTSVSSLSSLYSLSQNDWLGFTSLVSNDWKFFYNRNVLISPKQTLSANKYYYANILGQENVSINILKSNGTIVSFASYANGQQNCIPFLNDSDIDVRFIIENGTNDINSFITNSGNTYYARSFESEAPNIAIYSTDHYCIIDKNNIVINTKRIVETAQSSGSARVLSLDEAKTLIDNTIPECGFVLYNSVVCLAIKKPSWADNALFQDFCKDNNYSLSLQPVSLRNKGRNSRRIKYNTTTQTKTKAMQHTNCVKVQNIISRISFNSVGYKDPYRFIYTLPSGDTIDSKYHNQRLHHSSLSNSVKIDRCSVWRRDGEWKANTYSEQPVITTIGTSTYWLWPVDRIKNLAWLGYYQANKKDFAAVKFIWKLRKSIGNGIITCSKASNLIYIDRKIVDNSYRYLNGQESGKTADNFKDTTTQYAIDNTRYTSSSVSNTLYSIFDNKIQVASYQKGIKIKNITGSPITVHIYQIRSTGCVETTSSIAAGSSIYVIANTIENFSNFRIQINNTYYGMCYKYDI